MAKCPGHRCHQEQQRLIRRVLLLEAQKRSERGRIDDLLGHLQFPVSDLHAVDAVGRAGGRVREERGDQFEHSRGEPSEQLV